MIVDDALCQAKETGLSICLDQAILEHVGRAAGAGWPIPPPDQTCDRLPHASGAPAEGACARRAA